jgi:hypothetical protein
MPWQLRLLMAGEDSWAELAEKAAETKPRSVTSTAATENTTASGLDHRRETAPPLLGGAESWLASAAKLQLPAWRTSTDRSTGKRRLSRRTQQGDAVVQDSQRRLNKAKRPAEKSESQRRGAERRVRAMSSIARRQSGDAPWLLRLCWPRGQRGQSQPNGR